MTTRSDQLWASTIAGRPAGTLFESPSLAVVILKSVYWASTPDAGTVTFYVQHLPFLNLPFAQFKDTATTPLGRWDGWLVLQPQDLVVVTYDTGTVISLGSGAVLPQM